MQPERWAAVESLYHAALEREPAERERWLQQACGDDGGLRTEVESLLACADAALSSPAARSRIAKLWNDVESYGLMEPLPSAIGRYRILRKLGEGGMGVVYEAEQEQPRRTVALKVVKSGLRDPKLIRRFEQESLALGRLQHPGIAQIYEAGTAENEFGPLPYFAMEFIRGQPLLEYANAHQTDIRHRLDLMARICEAVQHAHQRGIIHRDLKPGNILVDETGQPKILDFGVARATDSDARVTRQTDLGQLVGTLAYMSPEQVIADPTDLDTRSDVYALGVILYELLAGRLPYRISPKLYEAAQTIREEEPSALRAVSSAYRGDIETIVGKALEKDKTRRYSSAAEMAADIRRYLQDEPIMARPASTAYQLKKFARRHKALVLGVAAVFIVLIAGIAVSTREAARANAESATSRAISDFLQNDLLAQASAANQSQPATKSDPDLKVRTALDRAAAKITGKFDRQPEVEAAIRNTIGQTYMDLGLYPQARTQLERARDLRRRVLGATNPETLKTTSRIGYAACLQGKYPEAESLMGPNLEIQRRVLGPDNPDTLSSMSDLGIVYWAEGKYAQAEALDSQNLEIQRRVLGPEHPDTLKSMNDLAIVFTEEGKYAQAEAIESRTVEIRRRVLGPEHPNTMGSMHNLAYVYFDQGKYAQAEKLDGQILEICRRALGPEHPQTLLSANNLASDYLAEGKYAQAHMLDIPTLEAERRALGPEHPQTLMTMNNLASDYLAQRKYPQAETLYRQSLEVRLRLLGPAHPNTLATLSQVASAYQRHGKFVLAESYAVQALAGRRRALGSQDPDTLASVDDLALAYQSQDKFAQAEPLAREALEFNRKKQPDDWQRFRAESLLGASLAGQKKYAEAEPLLLEGYAGMAARKARIAVPDWYHLDRAGDWLVQLYQAWGKPLKATEWRKKLQASETSSFSVPR
jgi:serine/threonine protein kinase